MIELPRGAGSGFVAVREGRVFFQQQRWRSRLFQVAAVSVHGGRAKALVSESSLPGPVEEVGIASGGVFYVFTEPDPQASGNPNRFLFSPEGDRGGPAQTDISAPQPQDPGNPFRRRRMRWLSWNGAEAHELLGTERAVSIRVNGDYCYWIRRVTLLPAAGERNSEPQDQLGELMVMPIRGGVMRRIARVPLDARLEACGDGISWQLQSPDLSALLVARPPGFSIEAVPDCNPAGPPVLIGERIYWIDAGALRQHYSFRRGQRLLSARKEGRDRQVHLDPAIMGDDSASLGDLFTSGGALYLSIDRSRGAARSKRVVQYRPDRGLPPKTLLETANSSLRPIGREGDYLYSLHWESRENWLDWSSSGLIRRRVGVLSRLRLAR